MHDPFFRRAEHTSAWPGGTFETGGERLEQG